MELNRDFSEFIASFLARDVEDLGLDADP